MSTRPESAVTFKCLYNTGSLSCSTFYLIRKVDCLSVELGVVNVASSTPLVFGALESS